MLASEEGRELETAVIRADRAEKSAKHRSKKARAFKTIRA